MRAHTAAMATHIQGEVTTLCQLWQITRRDTVTYRFTTHDQDVPFDGDTYYASRGASHTALEFKVTLSVSNAELIGFIDDLGISESDLIANRFDRADIKMSVVNWKDPDGHGRIKTLRGRMGSTTRKGNQYQAEVRSLAQAYQESIGSLISERCRAKFGSTGLGCDEGCNYPLDPDVWQAVHTYGTQPVGMGAQLLALPNGSGDWDGGITGTDNLRLLSGGQGYSNDVTVFAYATMNDGSKWRWESISVSVVAGVITRVEFPPTNEGDKPGHSEITFAVIDTGFTDTHVAPTSPNGFNYKLVVPGVSGATQPTWPTSLGTQVTDGTAVWETIISSSYRAVVRFVNGRAYFEAQMIDLGDISMETVVLGGGALIQALPNGHGLWDGGTSPSNVQIVTGGERYVNPLVTAVYVDPTTLTNVEVNATQVGLDVNGSITYVSFPLTAEDHKPISSKVTMVVRDQSEVDGEAGFFDSGTVLFLDGENEGIEIDIKSFEDFGGGYISVDLYAPAPFDITFGVSDGTTVLLKIGCDHRWHTCKNRFHNQLNFRGEPGIPGDDVLYRIHGNE